MGRVVFTLKIETEERAALENLSSKEGRTIDQLIREALRSFLLRHRPSEPGLEGVVEKLRSYRERDTEGNRAREAFIEAEASIPDPIQGVLTEGSLGPAQTKIREMLDA